MGVKLRADERIDPRNDELDVLLVRQHVARYTFASSYVSGRSVLDVACGTGYGTAVLKRAGARLAYGVDISSDAIGIASQSYGGESIVFAVGDAENLSLPERFDVITSFETIEHVEHPSNLLRGVVSHLAPGGVFLVSTPVRQAGMISDTPANRFHRLEWKEEEFRLLLGEYFTDIALYGQYELTKRWIPFSRTLQRHILRVVRPESGREVDRYEVRSGPPDTPSPFPCVMAYMILVCRHPRRT